MSEKHVAFCKCGQEFIVETGVAGSFRRDGKRVYPSDAGHEFTDYFRCPTCGECVHETVPGAEFEDQLLADAARMNCTCRGGSGHIDGHEAVVRELKRKLFEAELRVAELVSNSAEAASVVIALQCELNVLKKAASCVVKPWAEAKGAFAANDVAMPLGVAFEPMNFEKFVDVTAEQLDKLAGLVGE